MTKRSPVSAPQNNWFDAQQVDDTDLSLEQNHNDIIDSSIINNHIGSGVLLQALEDKVLFDSTLVSGLLDGIAISTQSQPTDNSLGNQLEVTLSGSSAAGKKAVKIAIVGLDFQSNLQYETFVFNLNETQVTKKHFTKILTILFNDFLGDSSYSFNLGGKVIIKEAKSFALSRSVVMVAQDVQPNLFFRDFFVDGPFTVNSLLASALPTYNIDTLDIQTGLKDNKILTSEDVTTQIGQKFLATTNNIQKITLLLSVQNTEVGFETDLVWNGDLVFSVYPLQSNIDCPTDIAPNLEIDFSPANIPVAQLSFSYASLQDIGIVLDSIPQPVDFVLSNTPIAGGNILIPNNYYAFSLKRSGSANKCDILIAAGDDHVDNSRITTFTGTLWVDIPEEDLWFKIYTDAAKVSDGQAYDNGHGILVPKTITNAISGATVDFSSEGFSFVGNETYRAVLSAETTDSVVVQDQRTGNDILSRKEYTPAINLLNSNDIVNLQQASEPILLGAIADKNRKFYNSISSTINSSLKFASIAGDEIIIKIITDPTDSGRFDSSVVSLQTNLLLGDLIGAKISPNSTNLNTFYRIADAQLLTMIVGDVNGDGIIDDSDVELLNTYVDYNLNLGLPLNSLVVTDGVTTTFTNGYSTLRVPFVNNFGFNFQLIDKVTGAVVASGSDGVLVADPNDNRLANFTSSTVAFNVIVGLSDHKLVINTPSVHENYGGFDISGIDTISDVITLRKVILSGDSLLEMFRADIDGDGHVTYTDASLLRNYVDRVASNIYTPTTYPQPSTNAYGLIGTRFNAIKLKVEKFQDRTDDYSSLGLGRPTVTHPVQDIFLSDGYFINHNFYTNPSGLVIKKQLTWDESLVVVNSKPKSVPTIFTSNTGIDRAKCFIEGVEVNTYASSPDFYPGKIDTFAPNNVVIGDGEIIRSNGDFYKVDFEVGTIVLEVPDGLFGTEKAINIMDDFISDYNGFGATRLGYPAMRFADCSFVTANALANDQIRFSVSIQSFSPNTNGMSEDGYYGAIVDGKIGVDIDYSTGLLKLNFTNLYQDEILKTLTTKIQVNVFLKKGGFNNQTLFVDSTKVQNMLELISVFSGANVGGPSALVDLAGDTTGILPILHGGTGLNTVGASGTVLVSNGTSLSYQFISASAIDVSSGVPDAGSLVKTDATGKLSSTFYYINPFLVPAVHRVVSSTSATTEAIGSFVFRSDKIIPGSISINFEAILSTSNVGSPFILTLTDITNAVTINLVSGGPMTGTNTTPQLLTSDNLTSLIGSNVDNRIYQVGLKSSGGLASVTCQMARLVVTYTVA